MIPPFVFVDVPLILDLPSVVSWSLQYELRVIFCVVIVFLPVFSIHWVLRTVHFLGAVRANISLREQFLCYTVCTRFFPEDFDFFVVSVACVNFGSFMFGPYLGGFVRSRSLE